MGNLFKNKFSIIAIMLIATFQFSFAQKQSKDNLDKMFYKYEVASFDVPSILSTARSGGFFMIELPKGDGTVWNLELHNSNILADTYFSQRSGDHGITTVEGSTAIPTTGHIVGDMNTSVSLTFNDGFIYGFIQDKSGYNFIEPLEYFEKDSRSKDQFVIYNEKDIKPTAPKTCGVDELTAKKSELENHNQGEDQERMMGECFVVDYAIANDWLMFDDLGSEAAVENHAIGVTNNVQTNYDNEFNDELQLEIVQQFTVTSSTGDPWTSSTGAGTLLNSFRSWGPSGFAATHDIGSLWTDRDFSGSTIGIAYLGVVCTGSRYNCLQNWSNNASLKRVMVAHEIGHNFNAGHDAGGSGFIMAPSVNNTTTWSPASINSVDNHVASRWCLSNCSSSDVPPTAGFIATVIENCTPGEVAFTNTSTGINTSYEWSFPGGTPSSSTQENPNVTYANPGTYNATLTVSNSGGTDVEVQNNIINIVQSPEVDFGYAIDETVVSFFNFSEFANGFFWDFGDGSSSSNSDPVHDYLDDGVYTVTLTAFSQCGDISMQEFLVIVTAPTAGFTTNVEEGCAPFVVTYTSTSSANSQDFAWTFPGGTPATSIEQNPTVQYSQAGTYDVILEVINSAGNDEISVFDYITVQEEPVADFTQEVDGSTVTLNNFSVFGETYIWTFGDGNTSTEENPTHTYENDGEYTIVLTSENECGSSNYSEVITISLGPIPSFAIASGMDEGCVGMSVGFESTSSNSPDSYEWSFEGGNPSSSTEANPTITYNTSGVFDVILTVTNENGSNSETFVEYVTVNDVPSSDFSFVESGLTVNFSDESIDADSYDWDFGDGNSSTEPNPTHTYNAEGVYTVLYTVTNECGSTTHSELINNYTPVSADFEAITTSGCANFEVEFSDMSSDNVVSWSWTFVGGTPSTSTEANPVVLYTEAGQYDVVLTVSHPESTETITLTDYIAVSDVPVTSFEVFEDLFDVDFTNTTVEGDSYSWDFGDGNVSNMENPSHTYTAEGNYEVVLNATNACGTTSTSQTVSINALPTAGISAVNSSGCGPLAVQFNNASSSNVTAWAWTFEGGTPAASTDENPEVVYSTPGTYPVKLVVTSPAGMDEVTIENYITVLDIPTIGVNTEIDGNVVTATNSGSGANEVIWTVNGETFNTADLQYEFSENGIYEVEAIASNECGSVTDVVTVEIDAFAVALLDEQIITICVGEELTLSDNSINAETRMWTLNGANPATSTDENPTVIYNEVGTYDIMLTVGNSLGESSTEVLGGVVVIAEPVVSFDGELVENMVTFTSSIEGATSFFWDFGDGDTSNEENPIHTYDKNGEYTVILVVENQCGTVMVSETYNIVSNSVTEAEFASMKLYPNPASEFITIDIDNYQSKVITLSIVDMKGSVIRTESFNSSIHTINTANLMNGTYMFRLSSEKATFLRKVVIMK